VRRQAKGADATRVSLLRTDSSLVKAGERSTADFEEGKPDRTPHRSIALGGNTFAYRAGSANRPSRRFASWDSSWSAGRHTANEWDCHHFPRHYFIAARRRDPAAGILGPIHVSGAARTQGDATRRPRERDWVSARSPNTIAPHPAQSSAQYAGRTLERRKKFAEQIFPLFHRERNAQDHRARLPKEFIHRFPA